MSPALPVADNDVAVDVVAVCRGNNVQGVLASLSSTADMQQLYGTATAPQVLADRLSEFDGAVAAAGNIIAFPPALEVRHPGARCLHKFAPCGEMQGPGLRPCSSNRLFVFLACVSPTAHSVQAPAL